jgi:ABC-type lipoprotein export system ATPase subunit
MKTAHMNIVLDSILPTPLKAIEHSANSIWGKRIELFHGKKILLNAFSGKGKSTFTHIIMGLRNDFTGTLTINNRPSTAFSHDEWSQLRQTKLSAVFQDLQLFPQLTVQENLQLKNELHPIFDEEQLKALLGELDISEKWHQRCGTLSLGQQQRVAIARSLCQPFQFLILDEPFSHLDTENTTRALKVIEAHCKKQHAGFILTTLGSKHAISFDEELTL